MKNVPSVMNLPKDISEICLSYLIKKDLCITAVLIQRKDLLEYIRGELNDSEMNKMSNYISYCAAKNGNLEIFEYAIHSDFPCEKFVCYYAIKNHGYKKTLRFINICLQYNIKHFVIEQLKKISNINKID